MRIIFLLLILINTAFANNNTNLFAYLSDDIKFLKDNKIYYYKDDIYTYNYLIYKKHVKNDKILISISKIFIEDIKKYKIKYIKLFKNKKLITYDFITYLYLVDNNYENVKFIRKFDIIDMKNICDYLIRNDELVRFYDEMIMNFKQKKMKVLFKNGMDLKKEFIYSDVYLFVYDVPIFVGKVFY